MQILLILLLAALQAWPETKTEADLRRQLAAAKEEIAARDAHIKFLQTKKDPPDPDACGPACQANTERIDAATERIVKTEADGKKLVETMKTQTAETRQAAASIVQEVKTQSNAVTSALTRQSENQARAMAAAREVARKLERANIVLAETNARNEEAKDLGLKQLDVLNQTLRDLKYKADIAAARDEASLRHDRYQVMEAYAVPGCAVLCAIVLVFQIMASARSKAQSDSLGKIVKSTGSTETMMNGQTTALKEEIATLKRALAEANDRTG